MIAKTTLKLLIILTIIEVTEEQNNSIRLKNLVLHNELQPKNSVWYREASLVKADKLIYVL